MPPRTPGTVARKKAAERDALEKAWTKAMKTRVQASRAAHFSGIERGAASDHMNSDIWIDLMRIGTAYGDMTILAAAKQLMVLGLCDRDTWRAKLIAKETERATADERRIADAMARELEAFGDKAHRAKSIASYRVACNECVAATSFAGAAKRVLRAYEKIYGG